MPPTDNFSTFGDKGDNSSQVDAKAGKEGEATYMNCGDDDQHEEEEKDDDEGGMGTTSQDAGADEAELCLDQNFRERRLAMNRVSAKLRRDRKRKYLVELEDKVQSLMEGNERLLSENNNLKHQIAQLRFSMGPGGVHMANATAAATGNANLMQPAFNSLVGGGHNMIHGGTSYSPLVAQNLLGVQSGAVAPPPLPIPVVGAGLIPSGTASLSGKRSDQGIGRSMLAPPGMHTQFTSSQFKGADPGATTLRTDHYSTNPSIGGGIALPPGRLVDPSTIRMADGLGAQPPPLMTTIMTNVTTTDNAPLITNASCRSADQNSEKNVALTSTASVARNPKQPEGNEVKQEQAPRAADGAYVEKKNSNNSRHTTASANFHADTTNITVMSNTSQGKPSENSKIREL